MNTAHTQCTPTTTGTAGTNSVDSAPVAPKDDDKASVSFRLSREVAAQLRTFVRDNAGKPLYLQIGPFVEAAIVEHIERTSRRLEDGDRPSSVLGRACHGVQVLNNRSRRVTP